MSEAVLHYIIDQQVKPILIKERFVL